MQAYLDHAATTPLRPEALAAMVPYLTEHFGNPSGSHAVARRARLAVDEARDEVARCLGCEPGRGRVHLRAAPSPTTSPSSVLHGAGRGEPSCARPSSTTPCATPARRVGGTTVPVHRDGVLDLDALADALGPDVGLVSVMLVNNEVGTVQPLAEVADLVRALAPQAASCTPTPWPPWGGWTWPTSPPWPTSCR